MSYNQAIKCRVNGLYIVKAYSYIEKQDKEDKQILVRWYVN